MRLVDWRTVNPVLAVWIHLRAGRFPCDGGYADQPALFVDLLGEVTALDREDADG